MGETIYNIADELSLLTSKLNPKLYEALQKLNELKKGLQDLEDLLIGGIQEIPEKRPRLRSLIIHLKISILVKMENYVNRVKITGG